MNAPLFNPAGIPDELKALRRWVPMKTPVWSESAGKWLKVPTVKWSDPSTWRTFDGSFMLFVIGGGYVSYDEDHCIDEHGRLDPQIGAFVGVLNTYTERSMGGNGIHCIAKGVRPAGSCDAELWDGGHLLAITGVRWPETNGAIDLRQTELEYVFRRSRKSTDAATVASTTYEVPDVVEQNNRHRELFRLVRHMKGLGASVEEARHAATLFIKNVCVPALPWDEAFFRRAYNLIDRPLKPVVDPFEDDL
jgi:primase-polymerase (primpol)-like protein